MKNLVVMQKVLDSHMARSAWAVGVKEYAVELLGDLVDGIEQGWIDPDTAFSNIFTFNDALLNGAQTWKDYSYGGCALIYDTDIASRLCNPSELKKTNNGSKRPNNNELWLDVQARALYQAAMLLWDIAKEVK